MAELPPPPGCFQKWEEMALEKVTNGCALVFIEWVDSVQPKPSWVFLEDIPPPEVVRCFSVGWLVGDTAEVKSLAPNMGHVNGDSVQASGIIQIPTCSVVRVTELDEPAPSSANGG